ncbi:potassium channel family protein [Streptomyces sp. NPDC005438]|uniref:potassium channel family protein n=1 Tax=Streptomyces sp. NPDC005438 TaxID=3156880 RepID=UPI0033B45195
MEDQTSRSVRLPHRSAGPLRQVVRRLLLALLVMAVTALLVYVERDGYRDNYDGSVSLLDSVYYTTVTLSTTGYGDIAPVSDSARLFNILLVTPLRVLFLIILVGTTLEVLTERTREQWRQSRWRSQLRDHTVIVGFGTKGRSAAQTLISSGLVKERIVVIDPSSKAVELATSEGYAAVMGDATRSGVLLRAQAQRAKQIVIATQRDDTAVLVTLTARQINPRIKIVAAVREEENAPLLRQSGADSVITSSSAAGRLLGVSTVSPSAGSVIEDLIHQGSGLNLSERPITKAEAGRSPRELEDLVVSVLRGHRILGFDDPEAATLQLTDRVVVIRRAPESEESGAGHPPRGQVNPPRGTAS